jgi:hypothetical protein
MHTRPLVCVAMNMSASASVFAVCPTRSCVCGGRRLGAAPCLLAERLDHLEVGVVYVCIHTEQPLEDVFDQVQKVGGKVYICAARARSRPLGSALRCPHAHETETHTHAYKHTRPRRKACTAPHPLRDKGAKRGGDIHTHTHVQIETYTHWHTPLHTHSHIHKHIHTHTCKHKHKNTHREAYKQT